MNITEIIFYMTIGGILGFSIGAILLTFPIVDDLKFLLGDMKCEDILQNAFEFKSQIPDHMYDNKECWR